MFWIDNSVDCLCLFVGFKHPNCLRSSLPKGNFSFKCDAAALKKWPHSKQGNFLLISCQIHHYLSCASFNNHFFVRQLKLCTINGCEIWTILVFKTLGFYKPSQELHENVTQVIIEYVYHWTAFWKRSKNFSNTGMICLRNSMETLWLQASCTPFCIWYSLVLLLGL